LEVLPMRHHELLCGALLLLAACSTSEQTPAGGASGSSAQGASGTGNTAGNGPGNDANDAASAGQGNGNGSADAAPAALVTCGEPITNDRVGNECHDTPPPPLTLTPILDAGLIFAPMMLASPPGDASRLFVITRGGIVAIIKDGVLVTDPFLDLTGVISANNGEAEHGLLGLAFDPSFASNGKIWLHYNIDATQNPIDSVTASVLVSADNPDRADPATLTPLFVEHQPAANHNGGMLAFGRDGCLYVGFGDGGGSGDPLLNGQNTDEPMGSILRIDAQTGGAAPGNPGFGDPRIWNYGLRNPWRFSFDRANGDLYIGDVGQLLWEEIDVEPAGTGDFNYGWNRMEATHAYAADDPSGVRMPIIEYDHDTTGHSVTGGYVYRGTAIPELVGRYLYADYKDSRFWVLTYAGESPGDGGAQPQICDSYEVTPDLGAAIGPTAFGEDLAGELYVLTLGGAIYRIDPA
jgi:glucose/arabinose dehydrogenase